MECEDHSKSEECSYQDLPRSVLHCHFCNIQFRDGKDFGMHIHSESHSAMVDAIVAFLMDYIKILRLMCQNAVADEHKHRVEDQEIVQKSYCAVCDLVFYPSKSGQHCKTKHHAWIKQFLHPKCPLCHLKFQSPVKLELHFLTCGHLRQLSQDPSSKNACTEISVVRSLKLPPPLVELSSSGQESPADESKFTAKLQPLVDTLKPAFNDPNDEQQSAESDCQLPNFSTLGQYSHSSFASNEHETQDTTFLELLSSYERVQENMLNAKRALDSAEDKLNGLRSEDKPRATVGSGLAGINQRPIARPRKRKFSDTIQTFKLNGSAVNLKEGSKLAYASYLERESNITKTVSSLCSKLANSSPAESKKLLRLPRCNLM